MTQHDAHVVPEPIAPTEAELRELHDVLTECGLPGSGLSDRQEEVLVLALERSLEDIWENSPAARAMQAAMGGGAVRRGIYIASKTQHAHRWRYLRDTISYPVISTWIDEAGGGETGDWGDLWDRCISEAASAAALIVYREEDETLKGAWVEVGAALAAGVPVFAVGVDEFSIAKSGRLTLCRDMKEAVAKARAIPAALEPAAPQDTRELEVEGFGRLPVLDPTTTQENPIAVMAAELQTVADEGVFAPDPLEPTPTSAAASDGLVERLRGPLPMKPALDGRGRVIDFNALERLVDEAAARIEADAAEKAAKDAEIERLRSEIADYNDERTRDLAAAIERAEAAEARILELEGALRAILSDPFVNGLGSLRLRASRVLGKHNSSRCAADTECTALREALAPFAAIAGPIKGEDGRPTYLEMIIGEEGSDELSVGCPTGTGFGAALDADDFRRARAALAQQEGDR